MYDERFTELVKVAVEKLKEDTVFQMIRLSPDYQKESDARGLAEQQFNELALTKEQRQVCEAFLDYRDRQNLECSDDSYIAGLYDAFRILVAIVWRCCTRVEHGPEACDAPTVQESDLQAAVIDAISITLGNRDRIIATLQKNVEMVIWQENETSSESIDAKLVELQKEFLKLANSKKDYNGIADEIYRLRELKQNALVESAEREGVKQRIKEMKEFLDSQSTEVTEYDELLVRRLIEKVTVYEERFEVEFKSGAKVDVAR